MSAYRLLRITKTADNESAAGYDYDDFDTAMTQLHNNFGIEVGKDTSTGVLCILINNTTGHSDSLQYGEAVKDRVYAHNDYMEDKVYTYDTEKATIGNYHTRIAAQRLNENCNMAITIRFDGLGNVKDFDSWTRPIVPPVEPEEPEEPEA